MGTKVSRKDGMELEQGWDESNLVNPTTKPQHRQISHSAITIQHSTAPPSTSPHILTARIINPSFIESLIDIKPTAT